MDRSLKLQLICKHLNLDTEAHITISAKDVFITKNIAKLHLPHLPESMTHCYLQAVMNKN